ncbi:MAG: DNA polymerase I [Legionellales bacterium]|nr:DNA polymerase I [Legionellales bacterium]
MTNPVILVDGSSYFYRAFHALPPLSNSKGEPTGAIYGVVNMIRRLLKDYQPDHFAVVFDAKGKTFRDKLYPDYKANREKMPDELSMQFPPLIEILQAMGLPLLIIDEVEADDVIATLAEHACQQGLSTLISTGDKDFAQLVNSHITLINTMTQVTLDPAGVREKFGVAPDQIVDYLTLIGDKVDNIPGVDKVGPKTAVKWLTQYKTLDELIAHADDIGGKVGENLRQALPQLPLAKQLITIKRDVPLDLQPNQLICQPSDRSQLIEWFKRLEFKSWLNDLLSEQAGEQPETPSHQYHTILTKEQWHPWLKKLTQADCIAFDTETTSLTEMEAKLVGMSFAITNNEAIYIPLAHQDPKVPTQLPLDQVLKDVGPILRNPDIAKIGQNLKYDMTVMAHYDIHLQGIRFDTMLESYVLNSSANRHDMDTLALKYLGKKTITFTDVAGTGKHQLTFDQIPIDQAAPYAAEDADITLQLHQQLWPQIQDAPSLTRVFCDIEMPLVPVLSRMERCGVLIDQAMLATQSKAMAKNIEALEQQAFNLAEQTFNLSSTKQLRTILFDQLKLPILQKTPTGQPSTAEHVLQELAYDYPLPKVILAHRSLVKLKSTYVDALPKRVHPQTGRVHTSYNQAVTATGRLSSTNPNLQNIPVRTSQGRKIRQAFIPPPNHQIVAADYSQIELRIMAHLSGDPGLRNAFANGWDIHQATAAEVFGVSLENVTAEQRRQSKAVNFGLIYGMSAFGLAKQLDISRQAAQEYIDIYFHRYPGVKTYMEETRALAHRQGYVETLCGRRLYLPEIGSRNLQRQRAAERAAINAPMQGTAADIIKLAMIDIDQWLQTTNFPAKMIMQVHDELVFEVQEHAINDVKLAVQACMENAAVLSVPLRVSIGIGTNWDEAH